MPDARIGTSKSIRAENLWRAKILIPELPEVILRKTETAW